MSIDRAAGLPKRKRFQEETTEALQARVDEMEGWLIDSAWSERFGQRPPNRRLNMAYMMAKAVLAKRRGDFNEGARLTDTLNGIEGRLGVDYSRLSSMNPEVQANPDALSAGAEIAKRLRSLLGIQVQQVDR